MALRLVLSLLAAGLLVCPEARSQTWIVESSQLDQQTAMWQAIKKALTEPDGHNYFERNLRDTEVPGGALGLRLLRGTVVSSDPAANPVKLMVAVGGATTPDVLLCLKSAWNEPIAAGTEVEFSGVPEFFTTEPYLLTFDVLDFSVLPAQTLALEIRDSADSNPSFAIMHGEGYLIREGPSLQSLVLSKEPSPARQASALKLAYKPRQDIVLLTAGVAFGELEKAAKPSSVNSLPFETVGTYSVRLNEVVVLTELENANLQPLTVNVVIATPPASFRPMAISNVPSLQMDILSDDRVSYHLRLRNSSSQNVTAVLIQMPMNESSVTSVQEGDGSTTVIAPNAGHELDFPRPAMDNAGPLQIVLEGALFEDGSAQGDGAAIAKLRQKSNR